MPLAPTAEPRRARWMLPPLFAALALLAAPAAEAAPPPELPFAVASEAPRFEDRSVGLSFTIGPGGPLRGGEKATFQVGAIAMRCADVDACALPFPPPLPEGGAVRWLGGPCAGQVLAIRRGARELPVPSDCGFVAASVGATPPERMAEAAERGALMVNRVERVGPALGFGATPPEALAERLQLAERLALPPPEVRVHLAAPAAGEFRAAWVGKESSVRLDPERAQRFELFVERAELPRGAPAEEFAYVLAFQVEDQPDVYLLPAGASYTPAGPTAAWEDAAALVGGPLAVLAVLVAVAAAGAVAVLAKRKDLDFPLPVPLIFLFTRLQRPHLLEQDTRRRVYEAIRAEPGIRYAELRARTGLHTGVLHHHLRILADHDLIVDVRRGRQRHLYLTGVRPLDPSAAAALGDQQARILALLGAEKLAQRELAARLGITQQGVNYHLRKLWLDGHVVRERGPSGTWLYTSARGGAPLPTNVARSTPVAMQGRAVSSGPSA